MKQLFRYAFGRHETDADEPLIQKGVGTYFGTRISLEAIAAVFRECNSRLGG